MGDLVGDLREVQIQHDPDWQIFPEVGEALRMGSVEDNCFCVAKCARQGKWAVGVGNGWKTREAAAKLAMALVLAVGGDKMEELSMHYPEFGALVRSAGFGDVQEPEFKKR